MRKLYAIILLFTMSSTTFISCKTSKDSSKGVLGGAGGTVAKTVITAVGVILLAKLLQSILGNLGGNSSFASLTNSESFKANFNESTKLNSFANNDLLKLGLQLLVSEKYKIPFNTVSSNYNSLVTAEDLATFIGKNAAPDVLKKIQ